MDKTNLHIHTMHSDGGRTVAEVVEELRRMGVEYFAITDHDTVEGNEEAAKLAAEYVLKYFNGVELSCCFEDGELGLDASWVCHIVGLGINLDKMRFYLKIFKEHQNRCHRALIEELIADGYRIELERIEVDGIIPSRTAVAKELIDKGYAKNYNECFEKILNTEKYIKYANDKPSISQGISIINECGGMAIWAHPFNITRGGKKNLTKVQVLELCGKMIGYGIDGIEVFYHKFNAEQIGFLDALAKKNKLFESIGTDYHMAKFDEKAHPEYIKLREKESIVFDVGGVIVDDTIVSYLKERKIVLEQHNSRPLSYDWVNSFAELSYRYGRIQLVEKNISEWHQGFDEDYGECSEIRLEIDRENTRQFFEALGLKENDFDNISKVIEEHFKFTECNSVPSNNRFYQNILDRISEVKSLYYQRIKSDLADYEKLEIEKQYLQMFSEGKLLDCNNTERSLDKLFIFCIKNSINYGVKYEFRTI